MPSDLQAIRPSGRPTSSPSDLLAILPTGHPTSRPPDLHAILPTGHLTYRSSYPHAILQLWEERFSDLGAHRSSSLDAILPTCHPTHMPSDLQAILHPGHLTYRPSNHCGRRGFSDLGAHLSSRYVKVHPLPLFVHWAEIESGSTIVGRQRCERLLRETHDATARQSSRSHLEWRVLAMDDASWRHFDH